MKWNVRKVNLGSVLLTAGVLMFLVGLSVSYDKGLAAYQNVYKETYSVKEWRVLRNTIKEVSGKYKCLNLGPAQWEVTGSFGDGDPHCTSGETCFEETWSVPTRGSWHQSSQGIEVPDNVFFTISGLDWKGSDDNGVAFECTMVEDADMAKGDFLFNGIGHDNGFYVYQAGLYGGFGAHINRTGLDTREAAGFHSWPRAWTIDGSVGTE